MFTTLSALKWLFSSVSPVLWPKNPVFSKALSHWVHLNCFSPVWFQSCNIKTCWSKRVYHTECTQMAFLQCESAVLQFVSFNSLPLNLKTVLYHKTCTTLSALKWLFSSVCPVLLHKTAVFSKVLSHWVHLNCYSTGDISHVTSKLVPHWVHSNGFSPV